MNVSHHHKKNSGSFRSLYKVFNRNEASLTRPGFIVLACLGQCLMQAQHVMHFSVSINLTVFRIDRTDRTSLCTDPALDTLIADRNKINIPEYRISPVGMTRLLPV